MKYLLFHVVLLVESEMTKITNFMGNSIRKVRNQMLKSNTQIHQTNKQQL